MDVCSVAANCLDEKPKSILVALAKDGGVVIKKKGPREAIMSAIVMAL